MNRKDIIRNLRQENKDLQTQLNITLEDLAEQCWANKEITKLNSALNEKEQQLKEYQQKLEDETNLYNYCNFYRRSLMKELKKLGCSCKNCYWLSKYFPTLDYYCSATKWEFGIEEERLDKCICHRFQLNDEMQTKLIQEQTKENI